MSSDVASTGDQALANACYNGYEGREGLKTGAFVGAADQAMYVDPIFGGAHNDQGIINMTDFLPKFHQVQVDYQFTIFFDAYTDSGYRNLPRHILVGTALWRLGKSLKMAT